MGPPYILYKMRSFRVRKDFEIIVPITRGNRIKQIRLFVALFDPELTGLDNNLYCNWMSVTDEIKSGKDRASRITGTRD